MNFQMTTRVTRDNASYWTPLYWVSQGRKKTWPPSSFRTSANQLSVQVSFQIRWCCCIRKGVGFYTSEKEFSEMHFESPRKSFILHFSQSAHYYTCQFPLSSTQQVEESAAISANWRRSPTQSPTTPWLSSSGGVSIKWFWNTTTHSGFWHLGRNGKTKIIWWQLTCNPVA